ncbi:MAG: HupE/UreJ family protein [Tepidisphaeraceae bacterium]
MTQRRSLGLTALTLLTTASLAHAHPGHDANGLVSGLTHPVTGLDHLLAMVGVGLLAAGLKRGWMIALPATFVVFMIAGAAAGVAGLFVPTWLAETGIALSVFVFGVLMATGVKLPTPAVASLVALFAVCHGSAHAAEVPANGSMVAFFSGFVFTTIILHAVGIALGVMAGRQKQVTWLRVGGGAIGTIGALMLIGLL